MRFSKIIFYNKDLSENNSILLTFNENTLYVPYRFTNPFVDMFYYDKTNKTIYAFQITISVTNHRSSDIMFRHSKQLEAFKSKKWKGIGGVIFVWIGENFEFNEISQQFEPENSQNKKMTELENFANSKLKDRESFYISARKNPKVWSLD